MNTSSGRRTGELRRTSGTGSRCCTVFRSEPERQSLGRHEMVMRTRSRRPSIAFESLFSARSSFPSVSFSSSTASRKNQARSPPSVFHRSNCSSSAAERMSAIGSPSRDSSGRKNANRPSPVRRFTCSRISSVFPDPASASRMTRGYCNNSDQPMSGPNSDPLHARRDSMSSSSESVSSWNRR